jgi:AcrR family transcriptional regulator
VTQQIVQQEPGAESRDAEPLPTPKRRHRMAPQERERFILDNALRFFAERGLSGETRELARRLDITQSLIYRYFPSKDELIGRVYDKWFTDYWNDAWPEWIGDRSISLETRLLNLYRDYARVIFNYEWVRLFAFSGLNGLPHHMRFVMRNRAHLFPAIARELRHDHGMPSLEAVPLTDFEHEQLWGLHATIYYVGQRRWLFGMPTATDVNTIMAARVSSFVTSTPAQVATHLMTLQAMKQASD